MSQYIGKTISLVSNSNIRYVGILHEINSEQSTVSLEQVRSYGTEGRRGGIDEIPPSEGVYEFIIFRGSDVKDLKIADSQPAPPPPPPAFSDPAIIQSQAPPASQQPPAYQQQQQQPPVQQQNQAPAPAVPAAPVQSQPRSQPQVQQQQQQQQQQHHNKPKPGPEDVNDKDYDFQTNNALFTKEHIDQDESFYDRKSSFFDNISSTAKERVEGSNDNLSAYERRGEERKLNLETFGQAQVYHRRGGRGGGRGRGGFRGRGRGRGRGGSNNVNANGNF